MDTLLVSLGTSPAIVPEAYLLPGAAFRAVHVLTTDSTDVAFVLEWFSEFAPEVELTVTRVADFIDLRSESDHFHFEEVLYRWILECRSIAAAKKSVEANASLARAEKQNEPSPGDSLPTRRESPFICLAGGFKTMSSAMQKAAAVLGAEQVFHVLCDLPPEQHPKTAEQISTARAGGHLHWIKLGPEAGWPQFRQVGAEEYALDTLRADGRVRWVRAPDRGFCERLREIVERSHRIAGAWDSLSDLPFQSLATWSSADLDWLREPLDLEADRVWIASLPKLELHCHLGGFATSGEALQQIRAAAAVPDKLPSSAERLAPPGWPLPSTPVALEAYMKLGEGNGTALLRDPGCLRRQCELLYAHLLDQNVAYAEIRCSPANYASLDRSPWKVLAEIRDIFDGCMCRARASGERFCHVNLLLIATRRQTGDYRAGIARHLALAVSAAEHWTEPAGCRVVGVDLAGYEDISTRAHYFREEFTGVHRCGLALTVHAGENDAAEGIWSAVFDLNARRLGHALHLIDSPELMRSVADRGIGIEMCPYANYQIKGFRPMPPCQDGKPRPDHPLKCYLEAGIRATVNTDNIGISAASLTDNLLFAARLCPNLTRMDVLRLQAHALQVAFVGHEERRELSVQMERYLPGPHES